MAKNDLTKTKGTIAYVLNQHSSEIYSLMQSYSQFMLLKLKVNEILSSSELDKNRTAADQAIRTLGLCAPKYNLYISTLATYMTGIKVS